ncbi:unnamed protein product [Cuscuta europaea]|uniref:Uncharacterized protein n=1 Tax=Cuscuta europaea TaxID=41803 RepID=A0A9P1E1W2_CUSEU|nr:unnamed protein product [Cuscuta europaea]
MRQQANKHMREVQLEVGERVYLKIQPYKLRSLAKRIKLKLEAKACYLCLLIERSSQREDLVRASSILFLNNLNMLMDIVFHYGACVLVFAPCGTCFQTMISAAYSITCYVCLWMTNV